MVPFGPLLRSMTGVEVTPICGVIWLHPKSSKARSPNTSKETFHNNVPPSASKAYTLSFSVTTYRTLCVPWPEIDTPDRQIQWLGIDHAIHWKREQVAENTGIDIAEGQNRLLGILAGSVIVVGVGHTVGVRSQPDSASREKDEPGTREFRPGGTRKEECWARSGANLSLTGKRHHGSLRGNQAWSFSLLSGPRRGRMFAGSARSGL